MEDFEKLSELNISCSGHIVIAKYGKIFRGDKVKRNTLGGRSGRWPIAAVRGNMQSKKRSYSELFKIFENL